MNVNNNKPQLWKQDVFLSVDFYNNWFLNFAPQAYRDARNVAIDNVDEMLLATQNLYAITPEILKCNPKILSILRMATAPPIARDRLTGLANVSSTLVQGLESGKLPSRISENVFNMHLIRIIEMLKRLLDVDIFPWLEKKSTPKVTERRRAASIVADRVCGAVADPIIRNEQERRQLAMISHYLRSLGYKHLPGKTFSDFREIPPGSFTFHFNVKVDVGMGKKVNIPVDVIINRKNNDCNALPLLIECKSAGDFTNTNKRRKEEAVKMAQLRTTYGQDVEFILFLCGYFDSGYLGYEAAEGIDWVWEHRAEDLLEFGI